jgi:hypothetical protein
LEVLLVLRVGRGGRRRVVSGGLEVVLMLVIVGVGSELVFVLIFVSFLVHPSVDEGLDHGVFVSFSFLFFFFLLLVWAVPKEESSDIVR